MSRDRRNDQLKTTDGRGETVRNALAYRDYRKNKKKIASWSPTNSGNRCIDAERRAALLKMLKDACFYPLDDMRILEVGCGIGDTLASFLDWGGRPENMFGIDTLEERIREARAEHPHLNFEAANAAETRYEDGAFDVVVASTIFSSILNRDLRTAVAAEIDRVLKIGGVVIWYDLVLPNPFNPNVRPMKKSELSDLFRGYAVRLERVTLLPPLARRLGPLTLVLYPYLTAIPFLHSHYIGLLIKNA